jgi:hypothetical protein
MSEQQGNKTWTGLIWGLPALFCLGYAAMCLYDGWFRGETYEHKDFSRWVGLPVALAAGVWCAYRGLKELRQLPADAGQGAGGEQDDKGRGAGPPSSGMK